jgi:hypothetical protein
MGRSKYRQERERERKKTEKNKKALCFSLSIQLDIKGKASKKMIKKGKNQFQMVINKLIDSFISFVSC